MARSTFGGTTDDAVEAVRTIAGQKVASPQAGVLVTFWSAKTGGTQYTDLQLNGVTVSTITSDSNGQLPEFFGPDNVASMWADAGGGRVKINTNTGPTDASVASFLGDPGSSAGALVAAKFAPRTRTVARLAPSLLVAQPDVMATPPTIAVSGPGGSSGVTPKTTLAYNDARITHLGQVNITYNQLSTDYWQNSTNASDTPQVCADEFDHYGDDFAVRFRCASTANSTFWLWVDGKPATAAPVTAVTGTSGGSLSFYRVTFGSVALRRIRLYRVLADFGGIDVKTTHALSAAPRTMPKLFIIGDSYIDGTGATTRMTGMAPQIGRLLGMETFQGGQGGTGYVSTGGGGTKAPYTDAARIAKITAANPDYVLVFGSQNDDGLSGVQAAATSVYSQLATALPNTKVIVVGPPALGGVVSTNRGTNRDAVKAAALAAPNVLGFIDPNNDAQGLTWVSGSGNNGATVGDGNADIFRSSGATANHPSQAGHDYYARRIAEAASALLNA